MKSTIIIPNYNGLPFLENCLRSLEKERAAVIVVDNGSTDGSYEMIADKFPSVKTIRFSENTGFCRAVNAGIAKASTKYVILLNNDTEAEAGFVEKLEAAMEEDARIFSASAKLISMQERELLDDAGDFYCALGWAFAFGKGKPEKDYQNRYDIFAACAAAAIYKKSVLQKIGAFDENHFAYLEDIDLGYRARIHGFRNVFIPDARIYHAGSASSGSRYNEFKVNLSSRNNVYLLYKNMPFWQIVLNLPFLLPGFFLKYLFFLKKGLGGTYLRGLGKGIKLCASPEGRAHKVHYSRKHFRAYCRIQLALWGNLLTIISSVLYYKTQKHRKK